MPQIVPGGVLSDSGPLAGCPEGLTGPVAGDRSAVRHCEQEPVVPGG